MVTNHEINKTINDYWRTAYNSSNDNICLCCGKEVPGLAKSHSIPKFVLKNIDTNGLVYTQRYFSPISLDNEAGIKNGGVFKRICTHCENTLFRDYESEAALSNELSNRMMAQIDLKNRLKLMDKKLTSLSLLKKLQKESPNNPTTFGIPYQIKSESLDLEDLKKDVQRDLRIIANYSTNSFRQIYRTKLKYITPIAFQGSIALSCDLNGNIINELHNLDASNIVETISVCVFPLKTETIVIMFTRDDNRKYDSFIRQFKKLKKNEKLRIISYNIINSSEDFFISKKTNKDIMQNDILALTANNTNFAPIINGEVPREWTEESIRYSLDMYKNFPNILNRDNAIVK